jgi:hypothetical protein
VQSGVYSAAHLEREGIEVSLDELSAAVIELAIHDA